MCTVEVIAEGQCLSVQLSHFRRVSIAIRAPRLSLKNLIVYGHIHCVYRPGGRFSKAPETFRARKAIAKSLTLRVQSCFIHIF